jgi:hypothetical protein
MELEKFKSELWYYYMNRMPKKSYIPYSKSEWENRFIGSYEGNKKGLLLMAFDLAGIKEERATKMNENELYQKCKKDHVILGYSQCELNSYFLGEKEQSMFLLHLFVFKKESNVRGFKLADEVLQVNLGGNNIQTINVF